MFQQKLKSNVNVVPRPSSWPLKFDNIHSSTQQNKRKIFDGFIVRIWGTLVNPKILYGKKDYNSSYIEFNEYKDEYEPVRTAPNIEVKVDANGKKLNHQSEYY